MAPNPNSPGANPPDPRLASVRASQAARAEGDPSGLPPSKPLQIFLLVALVVTGAAYLVDQTAEQKIEDARTKRPNKLRRLVEAQTKYLNESDLGREAAAKGDIEGSVLHYRRALTAADTPEAHLHLGEALLKAGNFEMGFSQFKEALREKPGYADVYLAWGRALTIQGKSSEVVQLYQDALRDSPKLASIHYAFANVLEQQAQTAENARHQAESGDQSQAAARNAAEAQLYASDAVKHYEAAAKLGLSTPEFWFDYGALLHQLKKFPAAAECLIKATTLKPTLGPAQFQLAEVEDEQGKYAEAIGHYEATLAALPDDPPTLNRLALLYATATNQDVRSSKMAVLLATRACDATTSQNARYLDTLARAFAADGNFFEAISTEDKAVRRATQLGDHELLREFQPRFNLFVQHKTQ